jgi:hypothetical protein
MATIEYRSCPTACSAAGSGSCRFANMQISQPGTPRKDQA